jgi:hypothetical protein
VLDEGRNEERAESRRLDIARAYYQRAAGMRKEDGEKRMGAE